MYTYIWVLIHLGGELTLCVYLMEEGLNHDIPYSFDITQDTFPW